MRVRFLTKNDYGAIQEIENRTMLHPWSASQLKAELTVSQGAQLVAEGNNAIIAFALFRFCKPEAEMLRIVVAENHQGKGVAKLLLNHGLRHLAQSGMTTCYAEVRASNNRARRLYIQAGFRETGVRPNYYRQPAEDAILLCTDLTPSRGKNSEDNSRH